MTAQILVDALCHGHLCLNRINLLIFDECHRAVSDHPMRQIMQRFESCPSEEQPRVLGLTASLLNSNVKLYKTESIIQVYLQHIYADRLLSYCISLYITYLYFNCRLQPIKYNIWIILQSLETTLHAKIATVNSAQQVQNYYATPRETIVEFNSYTIPEIGKHINCVIEEANNVLDCVLLQSSLRNIESNEIFRPKTVNKKLSSILEDIREQLAHAGKGKTFL